MSRTVGEIAALANVSVRTLHHYDAIGLVQPSRRSEAGYRLYERSDLERLQAVLFYRELGFELAEIAEVLDAADFDRGRALREQRTLVQERVDRLQAMVRALDRAIEAHERGTRMSEQEMFAVFGVEQRAFQEEAAARWGESDTFQQAQRRTADYTRREWQELKDEVEAIEERLAELLRAGADPGSEAAMAAAEAHRRHIDQRFFDCDHAQHVRLAEAYVSDPRFTAHYDRREAGLAAFVRDAIRANAQRAEG